MADSIAQQLAILQEAQRELKEAVKKLGEHNQAEDSHPIILRKLDDILQSDKLYTRQEIRDFVTELIQEHTNKPIQTAHPGWNEFIQPYEEQMAKVQADITSIKNRLDGEDEAQSRTDLDKQLQQVEDKYAPILANLQSAFQTAEQQGNQALADEYRNTINTTLNEKKDELLMVMQNWQEQNRQ